MGRTFMLLVILSFFSLLLNAQTPLLLLDDTIYHDSLQQWRPLNDQLEWIADPGKKLSIEQVPFIKRPWNVFPRDQYVNNWKGNVWLKLRLENDLGIQAGLALLLHNDAIDLFYQDNDGNWRHQTAGKLRPRSNWDSWRHSPPFNSPYTFQLDLNPGERNTYYIKVGPIDQNTLIKPFIANRTFFLEDSVATFKRTLSTQYLFHGVLWVMFLFHLLTYWMYKDKAYLYYSLYILSLSFVLIYLFEFDIFLPLAEYPFGWKIGSNIFLFSFGIFYALFLIHFLHEEGWKKRIKRLLQLFIYLQLGLGLLSTSFLLSAPVSGFPNLYRNWMLLPISIIGIGGLFYISWLYIRSDKGLARFVAINNFFIIGGLLVSTLIGYAGMSLWPGIRLTQMWGLLFLEGTIILQLVSFSLSLGYKGLETERERVKLKELDTFKSRFFANISHEFRTPLTLILGPIQNLMDKLSTKADRLQLKMVERNGRRLLRLINQILDLSKLEAGKLQLEVRPFDYIQTSKVMLHSFQSAAREKEIALVFKSEHEQLMAVLDQDKIEQVLINLLSNAIKYTPSGGTITLRVDTSATKGSDTLITTVSDTGLGIPEDQLPHVFQRFYQASQQDFSTNPSGTGIGLALTKELIELHKGKIRVESEWKKGTTFTFVLPMHIQQDAMATKKIIDASGEKKWEADLDIPLVLDDQAATAMTKGALQILLIEDNPEIRQYLKSCLDQKYELLEAPDGEKGVEMAIENIPDLIITDVMMPKKDGFAVVREIKKNEKTSHIPIIILTGKSSQESKLTGLQTTADDYLTKPFDARELQLRIGNLLSNRKKWIARFKASLKPDNALLDVPSQEQTFIKKAVKIVEENLSDENFSVEKMGRFLLMDRTQLFRKLKAITGKSPSQFIRSIRLKHAHQLLSRQSATVGEIAFSVGFSSTAYFNRCFKEEFGKTPGEVMN